MKLINSLLMTVIILCFFSINVSAKDKQQDKHKKHNMIWIIGADPDTDDIWMMRAKIVEAYAETIKEGFQQSGVPNFIISDRSNKAVFAIGGFVNFRTAYDWNNRIDNQDFVTYTIPMINTAANKERFLMDVSTSRLFFKTILQTESLGQIEAYIETDFRGNNNSLHLREAYVSFKDLGLTFGQTTTTFVDLKASVSTIDFQGPNAYTYRRNLMIRYHLDINPSWEFAVAVEMPNVSATTPNQVADIIPQRVPDIPLYIQYKWNKGNSHLRASGILRTMNYHNNTNMSTETTIGWGTMLSTNIRLLSSLKFIGQVAYGKGIGNYIQDLSGNGYDLVPNPNHIGQLQTLPTMGWIAGLQANITRNCQINAAYSQVNVWDSNNYFAQAPDTYSMSQYIVTNLFYNISPALNLGIEYLYGTRNNVNDNIGYAHRIQMMMQFNF